MQGQFKCCLGFLCRGFDCEAWYVFSLNKRLVSVYFFPDLVEMWALRMDPSRMFMAKVVSFQMIVDIPFAPTVNFSTLCR